MKKFISRISKTIAKTARVFNESSNQVAYYQATNPMAFYLVNRTMWH